MAAAFQTNAFQNSAFQTGGLPPTLLVPVQSPPDQGLHIVTISGGFLGRERHHGNSSLIVLAIPGQSGSGFLGRRRSERSQ